MSNIKQLIVEIMEMYEEGLTMEEIAEKVKVEPEFVEEVVEDHSNFYD
jgi:orotate phosphoribosyltransferase-like protein